MRDVKAESEMFHIILHHPVAMDSTIKLLFGETKISVLLMGFRDILFTFLAFSCLMGSGCNATCNCLRMKSVIFNYSWQDIVMSLNSFHLVLEDFILLMLLQSA